MTQNRIIKEERKEIVRESVLSEILPAERPADDPCSDQDDFLGGGQDEAGASPLLPSKEPAVAA